MKKILQLRKEEPVWRKGDFVEEVIGTNTRLIIVLRHPGESDLDVQKKLDRWRAGEEIEDVIPGLLGGKEKVYVFRFLFEDLEPPAS